MESDNKKLLLINPWIYDFTAYDLWSKPLGLLYLASFLRQYDFKISYIDCLGKYSDDRKKWGKVKAGKYGDGNFKRTIIDKPDLLAHIPRKYARYGIDLDDFIGQLLEHRDTDAVLVTSLMTYWYPGVKKVVELVRTYLPEVPVILGGIYATLLPEHAREVVKPDFIVTGPGELKTLELLAKIFNISINPANLPQNLDQYPYPAFDLINRPDYLIIMTSRGCPFNCTFCAQQQIAPRFQQRSPDAVLDELNTHYRKFRLRDFAFYDDALFISRDKHIKIILEKIVSSKLSLRFHAPNGLFAGFIDRELAALMHETHFKTVRLSFETSNEARREDMNAKVNNEDMIEAVRHLKAAGYRPAQLEAYVMMGLPGQTLDEVIASILFVHNLGVQVRLASFSPIPGTEEFNRAVRQGLIAEDIDPLLTNKTIFPLHTAAEQYVQYGKLRTFTQVINEAAKRGLSMFSDPDIGNSVTKVVRQLK